MAGMTPGTRIRLRPGTYAALRSVECVPLTGTVLAVEDGPPRTLAVRMDGDGEVYEAVGVEMVEEE